MGWYFLNYFIVFLIGIIGFFKDKMHIYLKPIAFFILFIFCFSRGEFSGWDNHSYVLYFSRLTSDRIQYLPDNITYFEPMYFFIPYVSKVLVGRHFVALSFAIFAFLGILFKLKSFYLSNSQALSLILYTGTFFMLHEMTQIRIGVASGIFLYSIRYIKTKDIKRYSLGILCACLFHYSSAVLFLLYFLNPNTIKKKNYFIALIVCSLMSILGLSILNPAFFTFIPKIQVYLEMMKNEDLFNELKTWNNPGFWINLLMAFFLLLKADKLSTYNQYFLILLKIHILSVLAYLMLAAMPVVAVRLSQLLAIVQIVLYPSIIYVFEKKLLGYIVVIGISLLYIYNYTLRVPIFYPYYTWW